MIHLSLSYKSFTDDDGADSGYREARAFAKILQEQAQVGGLRARCARCACCVCCLLH